MKQVYQTIVDKNHGNCMQAAFASLFDDELENVPNFIELHNWFEALSDYVKSKGYEYDGMLHNLKWNRLRDPKTNVFSSNSRGKTSMSLSALKKCESVNGFFYAGVCSPNLFTWDDPRYHAVLVDKNCNIVFDPNPNYTNKINKYPFSDFIDYNGVIDVYLFNKICEK